MDNSREVNPNSCLVAASTGVAPILEKSALAQERSEKRFTGPLSTKMARKGADLGSAFPDSFDWGIYDSLLGRYEGRVPYWGVVYKTTFRLVNHHISCTKCHYAFEIDTFGRGCVHNCIYCYARDQWLMHGCWNKPEPFPFELATVRETFHTVFETSKRSMWRQILEK